MGGSTAMKIVLHENFRRICTKNDSLYICSKYYDCLPLYTMLLEDAEVEVGLIVPQIR